jgi:hypothetical protein
VFTDGFRRWITSGSLVLFPVLLFLAFLTSPSDQNHEPHIFRAQAAKVEISAVLFHWAVIVMVFAIIGMAHAARARALTQVGAVVALIGAVSGAGLFIADFYDLATAQHLTDEQAVAITKAVDGYPGYFFGFVMPSFVLYIGLLCLLIALVRDRLAPWWVPVLMVAAVLVPFFTGDQAPAVQALGPLLQIVAYGTVAVRLARRAPVTTPLPAHA